MVTLGPNGLEFSASISSISITPSSNNLSETVNTKRFLFTFDSSISTTQYVTITNDQIHFQDIVLYQVLSNHANVDCKIYNISQGSLDISISSSNSSNISTGLSIMFLVLT